MAVHPKRRRVTDIISPPSRTWKTKEEVDNQTADRSPNLGRSSQKNYHEQSRRQHKSSLHDITNCSAISPYTHPKKGKTNAHEGCTIERNPSFQGATKASIDQIGQNGHHPMTLTKVSRGKKRLFRGRVKQNHQPPESWQIVTKFLLIVFTLLGALFLDDYVSSRLNYYHPVEDKGALTMQDAVAQYAGLELAALGPNERDEAIILPAITGLTNLDPKLSRLCMTLTKLEGENSGRLEATDHASVCATVHQSYRLWSCQQRSKEGLRIFEDSLGAPMELPSDYNPKYTKPAGGVDSVQHKLQKSRLFEIPLLSPKELAPQQSKLRGLWKTLLRKFGYGYSSCAANVIYFQTSPLQSGLYKISLNILDGDKVFHTVRSIFQGRTIDPEESTRTKTVSRPLELSVKDMKRQFF